MNAAALQRLRPTRTRAGWSWGLGLVLVLMATACRPPAAAEAEPRLAVTTSYLEAVARDLLGEGLTVWRLAEPGTCPGHFDLRPRQAQALRRCRVLVRFDFQKSLDERLLGTVGPGPVVVEVTLPDGVGVPASYLAACQQTAARLVALGWLDEAQARARLAAIAARLDALAHELTQQVAQAGLAGQPVLAAHHQRAFCQWLGLRVEGTFRAADTAGLRALEAALHTGRTGAVRGVIANRPEGTRAAQALAARLGVPVVVFDNFPARPEDTAAFDRMLADNVRALRALAPP